jgi:hypothetical protein
VSAHFFVVSTTTRPSFITQRTPLIITILQRVAFDGNEIGIIPALCWP